MRTARFLSAVIPLALAATPFVASAQMGAALPGKYRFSVGWLGNAANTTVRLDSPQYGTGTTIDFEDDLGFSSSANSFFAAFGWQMAAKHRLELGYNDIERTSVKTIDREIQIGDQIYPVNAKIGGKFGTQFVTLSYRYALFRRVGFEVGPSIAIPVLTVSVGAGVESASGQVNKTSTDVTVPPPLPGLYFSGRFKEKFFLQGAAQYMKVTLFGVTAGMSDYRLQGVWLPTKHVGGGLAWSGNTFKLSGSEEDKLKGEIKYGVTGPSIFFTFQP